MPFITNAKWGPHSIQGLHWIVVDFSFHPANKVVTPAILVDLQRLDVYYRDHKDWHHSDRPLNERPIDLLRVSSYHLLGMLEKTGFQMVALSYFIKSDGAVVVECAFNNQGQGGLLSEASPEQYAWVSRCLFPRNHVSVAVWDNPQTPTDAAGRATARWLSINFASGKWSVPQHDVSWVLAFTDKQEIVAGRAVLDDVYDPEWEAPPLSLGVTDDPDCDLAPEGTDTHA